LTINVLVGCRGVHEVNTAPKRGSNPGNTK